MGSLGSRKPKKVVIDSNGNWMVPGVYIKSLKKIADVLSELDPIHSSYYIKKRDEQIDNYNKLEINLKKRLKNAGVLGVAVLCSDQQVELIEWMGFEVIETYPRAEQLTPFLMHQMTDIGRKNNVRLCIDNLQSGPKISKELARDIGAGHVTLSNFPGGFVETDSWRSCIEDNVDRIINAMAKKL